MDLKKYIEIDVGKDIRDKEHLLNKPVKDLEPREVLSTDKSKCVEFYRNDDFVKYDQCLDEVVSDGENDLFKPVDRKQLVRMANKAYNDRVNIYTPKALQPSPVTAV